MQKMRREMAAFFGQLYPGESRALVFGEGDIAAKTLLIGEAPGEQEAFQGRPFVGKAGKNLDEFLEMAGLERAQMYITNVVKFRPTRISNAGRTVNRPPAREEIELFLPWLKREIAIVGPRRIVTLGNVPLKALLGAKMTIGEMHGKYTDWDGIPLYPLYHPASLIYNRALRPVYETDVRRLGALIHEQDGAQ